MDNLSITLEDIISTTVNFISSICDNTDITDFKNNIDADYREQNLSNHISVGYYYDEQNGNKLFGIESNVNQAFKVAY